MGVSRNGLNRLSEARCRAFVRRAGKGSLAPRKLFDGAGLFLAITPAGTPVWRVKYRVGGLERTYSIGLYPEIGLAAARVERDRVRALIRKGQDPVAERRLERARTATSYGKTFAQVTASWLEHRRGEWSTVHYRTTRRALDRDVLPSLGPLPIEQIPAPLVAAVIERVQQRGAVETAAKIRQNVALIFDYALVSPNPAGPVKARLKKPGPDRHRAALLDFNALGDVLRRTALAAASPTVKQMLRLIAFTGVRLGRALGATWDQFNLDGDPPTWVIPRALMAKAKGYQHDYKAILSPTIAAELREWRRLTGRTTGLVFPSPAHPDRPLTPEAASKLYRDLGLADVHTVHGWRAAFKTLSREVGGFSDEITALVLDHEARDDVARAYDRSELLGERVRLAHWWDSQLTAAEKGGEPLRARPAVVA